jgi:hypothetical protein
MPVYDMPELPLDVFVSGGVLANPMAVAIYYDDPKTPAFRHAATGWLDSLGIGGPGGRMPSHSFPVATVVDFFHVWRRLESLCTDEKMSIHRAAVFGHGSHAGGREQGLEFRPGGDGNPDTTLGPADVMALAPLTWTPTAHLMLTNCVSGMPVGAAGGQSIAELFARRQRVTTIGQRGWSSFSLTWTSHTEMKGFERDVYLWAYETISNTIKGLGTLSKRRIPAQVVTVR